MLKDGHCIAYHRWPQFGDFNILITDSIDDLLHYKYKQTYGIKWFVENIAPKYMCVKQVKKWTWIDLMEFYLQDQIDNHRDVFGLKLNL